jgi:membrane protease YdiL (CAAX protease family)
LHFQYGAAGILIIFFLAVFLGVVRLVTKSLIATISFHALWNLGAIVQIILYLNGVGN